ncbi:MAG: LytR C-terminal domain-containing protein [Thermoleophilia bacterium]
MSATIIAASAGGLVEQIGAYAGYASVVGLGILSLLYFAQAREVKRLREWAGRAPERAAELEQRVQADAQKRVVAQPLAPASAAGAQAVEARTQAATAAVYASIGAQPPPGQLARPVPPGGAAPAPGAAPASGGGAPGAVPPAPGAVPAAPPPGAVPPAPAPTGYGATQTPAPSPTPPPTGRPIVTATPVPGTTPAAAAAARVAAASRTIPEGANGATSQDTAESAAARPEPLAQRSSAPPSRFSAGDYEDAGGLSAGRIGMIVGGAVALVLVGVVLMVSLTGDDSAPPENNFGNTPSVEDPAAAAGAGASESGSGSGSAPASAAALTSAERRATNVAVLNGTTQTGLARAVANKVQEDGFTIASVATNADQSVPTTIVSYGGDNEPAALAVAKIIGIDRGSVQAADANTSAAATADVIVIVGSDQIE